MLWHLFAAFVGFESLWIEYVGWAREEQYMRESRGGSHASADGFRSIHVCLWRQSGSVEQGYLCRAAGPKSLPEALPQGPLAPNNPTESQGLTWKCLKGQKKKKKNWAWIIDMWHICNQHLYTAHWWSSSSSGQAQIGNNWHTVRLLPWTITYGIHVFLNAIFFMMLDWTSVILSYLATHILLNILDTDLH